MGPSRLIHADVLATSGDTLERRKDITCPIVRGRIEGTEHLGGGNGLRVNVRT